MRALTVEPGVPDSVALEDVSEPDPSEGDILVDVLAVGICGTDREIAAGGYGRAPDGAARLVIGHESLARVISAPTAAPVKPGDHVVGIVRRPDPVPCRACVAGEWDLCMNGLFTERGIQGRHGYASERARIESAFVVPVERSLGVLAVLLEPASVIAKAWEHIDRIGARTASFAPRRVLVTGAGPIGLLAAMMAVERGLETHVLDRVSEGPKPVLVRTLGAEYHTCAPADAARAADVVVECTGASEVVRDVVGATSRNGIVCLTGVSSGARALPFDFGTFGRSVVLENDVIFGSVNANRRHYAAAAAALTRARPEWLAGLITRQVPLARWQEAFERRPGDVKVVVAMPHLTPSGST